MRIFMDSFEAFEEIKRDLVEMGTKVYPKTMQDKNVEGDMNYATRELQNYSYSILNANSSAVPGVSQPWADAEFDERVSGGVVNPGEAYKLRLEVWSEFLHNGKFAYTYNERIMGNGQLVDLIQRIVKDPDSRQLWLSIWDPNKDVENMGGISRIPCSLGYGFQVREGKLNIHYVMRSNDFATHMANDVYLAMKLLEFVAEETKYPVGTFSHTIFSLHVYEKDVRGVF